MRRRLVPTSQSEWRGCWLVPTSHRGDDRRRLRPRITIVIRPLFAATAASLRMRFRHLSVRRRGSMLTSTKTSGCEMRRGSESARRIAPHRVTRIAEEVLARAPGEMTAGYCPQKRRVKTELAQDSVAPSQEPTRSCAQTVSSPEPRAARSERSDEA